MIKSEIWRDTYYRYVGESLQYAVFTDDMMIFSGKAWKNPSMDYGKICISDICRNWLEATVPDFLTDGASFSRQYREFTLYSASVTPDGFPIYTPLETYGFLLNWDYEGVWDGASDGISEPINGHMDSRMKLMYSVFSDASGQTICRDEELIKKIHISPSYIEAGKSGLTRTVEVTSNFTYEVTNNNYWIHISPSSGGTGTTVFTITVDANESLEDRSGLVYFGEGVLTIRQSEAALIFEVEPTSIYAPYSGGMYQINYTSNTEYYIISNVPWATASSSAGTPGSGFFTVTVQPSTSTSERTGNIRVGNVNVSVRQEAVEQELSVSPSSLSFDYTGGSKTITITSNSDYTITTNSPWIALSASSGTSGVTTITVLASLNSGEHERSGKIYIGNQEVIVYQDFNEYVNVYPTSIYAESGGGVYVVSVSSNTSYNISASSDWVSVNKTSGSGNGTVNITIAGNSTNYQRTAIVTIGGNNVSITQFAQGESPYVVVSPESILASFTGGTYTISVSSNTYYEISANEPWVVLSASSGTGNSTFTVTVGENSGITRNAQITIGGTVVQLRQGGSGSAIMYTYGSLGNANKVPKTDVSWGYADVVGLERENGEGIIYFNQKPTATPLQAFSNYGFSEQQDITSVNLPDSITYIGQESFIGNVNLTGITLPNSVGYIGVGAFERCSSLSYVPLPAGLTEIDDFAFKDTALTSVTIPDSVEYIGIGAYSRCTGITSVTLGSGVKRCAGAFRGCTSLPVYDYMYYADTLAVRAYDFTRETYTLKSGTKYIGNYMYYSSADNYGNTFVKFDDLSAYNSTLLYMTLPESLIELGDYTFRYCKALSSVTIPSSVEYIGSGVFFGARSLTELNYNGTMSQWNSIEKPTNRAWNYGSSITVVHCSDGDITNL